MRKNDYDGNMIVIEGVDGAGTTTQARRLASKTSKYYTFENTNGLVGRKVDEMIKDGSYSAETVALGFACDRYLHLEEEVIPKLEKGIDVVMDRYYHSSLVYQSLAGADYGWVKGLHKEAPKPDLTIILDVDLDTVLERIEKRDGLGNNIFEKKRFLKKVINGYKSLEVKIEEEMVYVDASRSKEKVFQDVYKVVRERF